MLSPTQIQHILALCVSHASLSHLHTTLFTSYFAFLPPSFSIPFLSHAFVPSSFFPPLFCSSSLSLFLSLFASSVFIPQGVLSQSEANLPNYKPHLPNSLSLTHTNMRFSCIHCCTHTLSSQIHRSISTKNPPPYFALLHCLFHCLLTHTDSNTQT